MLLQGCGEEADSDSSQPLIVDTKPDTKPDTETDAAKDLSGLWTLNGISNEELVALAFLDDGTYLQMGVNGSQPSSASGNGMEWGKYSLGKNNILTTSQIFDGNGTSGLSDNELRTVRISNNNLILGIDENKNDVIDSNENFTFSKAKSENILGLWKNDATGNELLAFAFFDDGTYVHLEVDVLAPLDNFENEPSGMEWGRYTLNSQTNDLKSTIIFDNNGRAGLSDDDLRTAKVSGNMLTIEVAENNANVIRNFQRQ